MAEGNQEKGKPSPKPPANQPKPPPKPPANQPKPPKDPIPSDPLLSSMLEKGAKGEITREKAIELNQEQKEQK
jgi:hypothetical protein